MGSEEPITELDPRFSSESAQATAWEEARAAGGGRGVLALDGASGRPAARGTSRATPGASSPPAATRLGEGLDVVVEGDAVRIRDETQPSPTVSKSLQTRQAALFEKKGTRD